MCLANPNMIATPKCKIPLDICLENPEWLPLVGCSGEGLPLQVCLDFPKLLTSPACEGQFCSVSFCVLSLFLCFHFFILFTRKTSKTLCPLEAKLIVVWSNFLVWAIVCKTCVQLITTPLELFPSTPVLPTPPSSPSPLAKVLLIEPIETKVNL